MKRQTEGALTRRAESRPPSGIVQFLRAAIFVLSALTALATGSAAQTLGPGAKFDELKVGATDFVHVQVRSVNARTLMISHDGGMASVRLRDLTPELQLAFGYTPEAEAAADAALAAAQSAQTGAVETRRKAANGGAKSNAGNGLERLLQSFGEPPEIRTRVDLRPQFRELALRVKNQGPRPSCAVFAIVSALEFQNAQVSGKPEQFSEEYLIWATSKLLNRAIVPPRTGDAEADEGLDHVDIGFALSDVVTALRAYGVPLQADLPYSYSTTTTLTEPPARVVTAAQSHNRVSIVPLPGHDQATRLANLVHALDHGLPVPIGLAWPSWRALRTGFLSTQFPQSGAGHAVTIVGYENKTGVLQDTVFIFKNSWGTRWGAAGYGFATYTYLSKNLTEAVLLEVIAAKK